MEYRIKQGDDLTCSYTGKPAKVLIQLIDTAGTTTQWFSREALLNADKLLKALEGISEPQPVIIPQPSYIPHPIPEKYEVTCGTASQPDNVALTMPNPEKKTNLDIHAAKAFEQACVALIQDPPPDKNGNQSGVPGFAIRELIAKYKTSFTNPKSMYPVVQKYFPTDKEVVDFWLGIGS